MAKSRNRRKRTTVPQPAPPEGTLEASWKYAKKRIFSPIKLPAWVVYLIAAYRLIPDLLGETNWWWDRARNIGGIIGLGAAVIASPYFSLGLIIAATLWLLLVGEPKSTVQHPSMRYIGWAIAGIIALGFFAIYVASEKGDVQPDFHVTANFAVAGRLQNGLGIAYFEIHILNSGDASIFNVGTPQVHLVDGTAVPVFPTLPHPEQDTTFNVTRKGVPFVLTLRKENYLATLALSRVVERGDRVDGWLPVFVNAPSTEVFVPGTTVTLKISDVRGKTYDTTYLFKPNVFQNVLPDSVQNRR